MIIRFLFWLARKLHIGRFNKKLAKKVHQHDYVLTRQHGVQLYVCRDIECGHKQ